MAKTQGTFRRWTTHQITTASHNTERTPHNLKYNPYSGTMSNTLSPLCGLITYSSTESNFHWSHPIRFPDTSPRANPSYHPACIIMVQRRIPMDTVHPHQNSGFVMTKNGTTSIKRCAGQAERAATLEAGVYRLQLTFPCSLHGMDWTLKTTFTREINRTLQADSARSPVNYIASQKCRPTMNSMSLLCTTRRPGRSR